MNSPSSSTVHEGVSIPFIFCTPVASEMGAQCGMSFETSLGERGPRASREANRRGDSPVYIYRFHAARAPFDLAFIS